MIPSQHLLDLLRRQAEILSRPAIGDTVFYGMWVSTVELPSMLSTDRDGKRFETMVFGQWGEWRESSYDTEREAAAGHFRTVMRLLGPFGEEPKSDPDSHLVHCLLVGTLLT